MNKPNFFLIGAPKCGTTSLYYYLKEHSDVFLPEIKEQHFFSQPEVKDTYYDVYFANTLEEYLDNYKDSKSEKIIADISPSYLYYKKSANKIKEFNSNAKVIAILRDPVDRTISHYLMDLRIGYVNKPLNHYLKDKTSNYYKEYIGNSLYYEKVKYYKESFGDNFLVLSFNDLKHNPKKVMDKVFCFLDIDKIELDFSKKYNTYAKPSSSLIYYLRKFKVYNFFKLLIPKNLKDKIKSLLEDSLKHKPKFEEEEKILSEIFSEENKKLEKLLGRKFW